MSGNKSGRNFEQLYGEGVLPLVTFAHHISKFPMEVWRAGTQHALTRISFGSGSDQETYLAATLLRDADSIVLDTVALFTVHELGIIDLLRDRFGGVSLPQLVFDDLQNMAFNLEMTGQPSGFIGKLKMAATPFPTSRKMHSKDGRRKWKPYGVSPVP